MTNRHFELVGWWMYVICAICFVITTWSSPIGLFGSLMFLLASFVFLIPYYFGPPSPSSSTVPGSNDAQAGAPSLAPTADKPIKKFSEV